MRTVIADERRSSIRDTHSWLQRTPQKGRENFHLRESGRICEMAELFLDGTCLPTTRSALVATVSKCKVLGLTTAPLRSGSRSSQ